MHEETKAAEMSTSPGEPGEEAAFSSAPGASGNWSIWENILATPVTDLDTHIPRPAATLPRIHHTESPAQGTETHVHCSLWHAWLVQDASRGNTAYAGHQKVLCES